MNRYTLILIFLFSFTYTKAQNIIVNENSVNISEDISFPYWLDSMSTIDVGSQVVSISALEFNIVPTNNGNNLIFVQTKNITNHETVPNGKTWKIVAVLLDSTFSNTTNSSASSTTTTNLLGFSLGQGVHSPDTLKFWRVDAINLKNDPATYSKTGYLNTCGVVGGSYPYTKCYYSLEATHTLLTIGDLTVNVSGSSSADFHNGSGSNCQSNPCPETYIFDQGFSNTEFEKLNFPIYISSDKTIEIFSSDIVLSVVEFSISQ